MKCPFCNLELKEINNIAQSHLILCKLVNNHVHIHGDINDKDVAEKIIHFAIIHSNLSNKFGRKQSALLDKKEIVFHNRQRIGDALMFTCGVRDFKKAFPDVRVNVISIADHICDNNPYVDNKLVPTSENTVKIGPSKLTNASNRIDWHFTNAYRISIEDALGVNILQTLSRPDIWLTEEEYNAPPVTEKPYWIIIIGGEKGWGCKMYPFERWQEFVNQNPDVLFYQLGAKEDAHPKLQGDNVVDYIGKTQSRDTGIRDLFKLFLNAEGSIGLVSFQMHLSAAFNKPCIVVAGAREPVSFTRYAGHQYLTTEGCLPCSSYKACWHCNIDTCKDLVIDQNKKEVLDRKVPKCVDLIKPEDLTLALKRYYLGSRLIKNKQSPKPKFDNVVKMAKPFIAPKKSNDTKFNIPFGATSIERGDWEFIEGIIDKHNIKTVLEFGCGLSTLLMLDKGLRVVSYETSELWSKKISKLNPKCDIRMWDGKHLGIKEKYDLAFVDGPPGAGKSGFPPNSAREQSTKIASERAKYVIVHDAQREPELMWQDKYIKNKFSGPEKGGRRCHFWEPKLTITTKLVKVVTKPLSTGKLIKFVSTARGWGGCARSITTIMKYLIEAGHKVEFIPFRNKVTSREFQACLKNELREVIVTENYDTLKESCDILFIYGDDYIWEFGQPEIVDAFSNLNADKKIMMLNYRRGKVGEIEWTKNFDKYMFLNSTQEKGLLKVLPNVETKVLTPCTELEEFFKVQPNYSEKLRIVRHSSQGNTKYSKNFQEELQAIFESRKDVEINLMPSPTFIADHLRLKKHQKNNPPIPEFLSLGNLFWYSLPVGYMDMGPRVILEAMASGLPILADNWGGAIDRVTPECGWLCASKEEHISVIKNVTFAELKKKGEASREKARAEFLPSKWVSEIVD